METEVGCRLLLTGSRHRFHHKSSVARYGTMQKIIFGAASTIAWPVTASAQSMPRHRAETSTQHVTPAGSTNQPIGLVWARQLLVGSGSFLTDKRFELRLLGRNYLDV
jgi:hypothetical protein